MIPTGRQIREVLGLVGLKRSILARKVGRITTLAIQRTEDAGDKTLSGEQATAIRQTLERLGVEFTADPPGVRLQQAQP